MKKNILFSILISSFLLMNFNLSYSQRSESNINKPRKLQQNNYQGQELTIYNCADYIDDNLITAFEEEYKCKINYHSKKDTISFKSNKKTHY